ncbi:MAG: GTPase Era [Acidobacteria bacterium]|nr:GTPase Era [Acidobacteriota bacterium]
MAFRSGFVAILGRPNAGKSTLLNALAGEKLAIVSPKPQTTRNRILGILHISRNASGAGAQAILIDTPGIQRPDSSLGRHMMAEVREAVSGCDLVLVLVDVARKSEPLDRSLLNLLESSKASAFLLLTKIDLLGKQRHELLPLIEQYQRLYDFREIIPISARTRDGLDLLIQELIANLPPGPRYFPQDQLTDQPLRFMAGELIREQVLLQIREEVPHAATVVVEQFEEGANLTRIAATLYCEREGQKRILVGREGQMLKSIGTSARREIERMLGRKVFLELFVKVRSGWRDSRAFIEELDWRRQLEYLLPYPVDPTNVL